MKFGWKGCKRCRILLERRLIGSHVLRVMTIEEDGKNVEQKV
jgi:hypothetical protein